MAKKSIGGDLMTKEEYRKHCEYQIERCIKLQDSKHLKEHELSLGLLNENECLINNKNNLIKYLEDKIKELDIRLKEIDDEELRLYILHYRDAYEEI